MNITTDKTRRLGTRAGCLLIAILGLGLPLQRAQAAGLLIADGGLGGVLEIREHAVQVTVNNGIAVTVVTQVFHNTENRQVEALYTFPVPKGASVSNFSMWINGKEMIGEVVEKKAAREIYESYKAVRRDPGLLEQTDYKTYEMRIFPIGPGADQKIQIAYYQELDVDHDWATYVYPLATVTRKGLDSKAKGKFGLNVQVKSEVPIAGMESPSHGKDFIVVPHDDSYCQASLEMSSGDLNRDVVLAYHLSRPQTGLDLVCSKPKDEDGYFCLTMTAGEELAGKGQPMDYIFILDVSGSMADDGKLGLSRKSISAFINVLGADDRFEIMTFNVAVTPLFKQLQTATDPNKAQAGTFLDSQTARGGTSLRPALAAAYKYADPDRPLNVVFLSDGMAEQGERATLIDMIRTRPRNARVFCVGVGNEVNQSLLEQMAGDSGGLAAFVSPGDDFQRQAQAFRRKLTHPVANNLRINFDGAQVYDVEPAQLPNLYYGSPVRLYGRYRKAGPVKVEVLADVAGSELRKSLDLKLAEADTGNPEIERMWAWHKMQGLMNKPDRSAQVLAEIIRLGEAYSIAGEYTSFIVLENDGEYKRWKINRRNELRIARDRKPQQQLTAQLDAIRTKAAEGLGPEAAAPDASRSASAAARNIPPQTLARGNNPPARVNNSPTPSRGWDIAVPRGGGAIDPLTGGVGLALASAVVILRRRGDAKQRVSQ